MDTDELASEVAAPTVRNVDNYFRTGMAPDNAHLPSPLVSFGRCSMCSLMSSR
jgi:hypothetical protein